MMPAVYFWTKEYANRDEKTWAFKTDGEFRINDYGVLVTSYLDQSKILGNIAYFSGCKNEKCLHAYINYV